MQTFQAEVGRVRDLTGDVRELELRLIEPAEIVFAAGQFVSFQVPRPGERFPFTRPYSIVSSPRERSRIDLLFNLVLGGPGSSWLYSLRTSDRVQFGGPAGTFVLRNDGARSLLFVATGTGIAPVKSMILEALATPDDRRVRLVWGLKREEDIYYTDEFRALAAAHERFDWVITLSRPSSAWTGPVGRVLPLVEAHVRAGHDSAVYVCGNSAMIKSVSAIVKAAGAGPVYREQYFRDNDAEPEDQ